jgi:hypothetical protein
VAHPPRGRARLGSVAILLAVSAAPAAAQNGYSFFDADRSAIDYRLSPVAAQRACHELRRLAGGELTILSAEAVAWTAQAPAHCRVVGVIAPEIQFEVALPSAWNRRIYMRGNGGFAGEPLDAPARVAQRNLALKNGFVAVQTNTGHDAEAEPLATFAHNNLQKKIDYSFRAVHVTIAAAKRLVEAHYGRAAAFSYWDGCSTGGRQGLMSAQRFPGDFDGIIAGAPVLDFTGTMIWNLWNAKALASAPLSLEKISLVADAVYRKCDAADGAPDGLIDDPRECDFDPAAHLPRCSGEEAENCFTAGQIAALSAIYGGVVSNGVKIFPGVPLGAEKPGTPGLGPPKPASGWAQWLIADEGPSRQLLYGMSFFRYLAFPNANPTYDWRNFDLDKDPARLAAIRALLDATDPDLSAFASRGGKIVMYFGWADTALTPYMGIDYYEKVAARHGARTQDFMRLFLVPGMFHCRGGVGVDRLDALTPLLNWVEGGKAPAQITASRVEDGKVVRTRPLCPYPQVARYAGSGSLDEAGSFTCRDP